AEHCAGWRGLVRSALTGGPDTIPPDDREYGWLTLTRATRQLAHHLGVVPFERVVAPLPASRDEARREIDPLLDALVSANGQARVESSRKPKGDRSGESSSPGKTGRPPDGRKQEVVNYVRKLRAKKTQWKVIPAAVFEKFKVRYTAETLRGYLKSG